MIQKYLELIKFSHTVFALPFALISVLVASSGAPSFHDLLWVIIAMVGARSGAMGFNRWIDRRFDAANPRTETRPSVTGEVSGSMMVLFILIAYAILVFAAYQLNHLAFYLSPVAIFLTMFYSYTKRFTSYSHLFLGLAIGSAPIAAWIAVEGQITAASLVLGLSVFCWIAGFDVLYALQDFEFDRKEGLFSIPAKFGVGNSLNIARGLHLLTTLLWGIFFSMTDLNHWFLMGMIVSCFMLIWEHWLLREGDLSHLDMAFFNMNGYISVTLFLATGLSYWI